MLILAPTRGQVSNLPTPTSLFLQTASLVVQYLQKGVRKIRSIRFCLLVCVFAVFFCLITPAVHSQFSNELLSLNLAYGTKNGRPFGFLDFSDKLVRFRMIHRDQVIDEQEAWMYFNFGETIPTGKERFWTGFVFRADHDDRPGWMTKNEPKAVKGYLSFDWQVAGGSVNLDYPLAYASDGQRWYSRIRVEDVELPIIKRRFTLALTGGAVYDFDPAFGFTGGIGIVYRNRGVEALIRSDESRVSFGKGLAF